METVIQIVVFIAVILVGILGWIAALVWAIAKPKVRSKRTRRGTEWHFLRAPHPRSTHAHTPRLTLTRSASARPPAGVPQE